VKKLSAWKAPASVAPSPNVVRIPSYDRWKRLDVRKPLMASLRDGKARKEQRA